MKTLISSKALIPVKVMMPALVGGLMLALERTIQSIFLQTEESESSILNSEPKPTSSLLFTSVCGVTKSLGEMISASYDNYFAFVLMMLVVNVFLHGLDIFRYLFGKRNQSPWKSFSLGQEFMKQGLISLLTYSLIFCFCQMIWIGLGSSLSGHALPEVIKSPLSSTENVQQLEMMLANRILEQEEITSLTAVSSPNNMKKKPSLSIGKLLGQADGTATSIQLSKDGNTAFVTTNFVPTLKIIDISDPEYPVVLSTFHLLKASTESIFNTILVLPDETKLFISNTEDLEVIDITNLKSPSLIASVHDPKIYGHSSKEIIYGFAKPNLIMSRDQKFLFVSGYGLQVFDISVPTSPVLVRSVKSQTNSGVFVPTSIALSEDGRRLYYSDGGLWIYNVEDPKNMKVMSSFNLTHPITSMILSNDTTTAFVLGQDQESKILLQKLDISDIYSIKEGQVIVTEQDSNYQPIFLERSPDNLFLMVLFTKAGGATWNQGLIFDTQEEYFLKNSKILVKNPFSVMFTQDYRRAFVGNGFKLQIVDFFLDFPSKNAYGESKNTIQIFDGAKCDFFALSKNEKMIFCIYREASNSTTSTFKISLISSSSSNLSNITSLEVPEKIIRMAISQDDKKAFLVAENKIIIVDISIPENLTILGDYTMINQKSLISFFTLSRDGKTGFLTFTKTQENNMEILDLSDPQNITRKGSVQIGKMSEFATSILSNDEQTLFLIANKLLVYNISNPSCPTLLKTLSILREESYLKGFSLSGILSPDGKTLIFRDESMMRENKIHLIDVSDVAFPQIQGDFRFPYAIFDFVNKGKFFWVSADSRTLYMARPDSLMVIDISNSSSPKYLRPIKILDNSRDDRVRDFSVSNDGRKAYALLSSGKIATVAIDPLYSTFIKQDILMLGDRYNIDLQVLKMNEHLEYEILEADFRFVKCALVERPGIENKDFEKFVLKMAPSWMNFDLRTQTLSAEAHRKNDLGTYNIYFGFSTQIEMNAFSRINKTIDSEDLVATLLALGYLDSQRFLTENFGEFKDFILPTSYSSIKEEIYRILKEYLFGTFNEIQMIESLNVTRERNKFQINTPSLTNLKIYIRLAEGQEVQFLSRHYGSLVPIITHDKSLLVMEGSLKDLNLALQEVVINLPENITSCDGEIIVDDKLNPVRTESVKNISGLFNPLSVRTKFYE